MTDDEIRNKCIKYLIDSGFVEAYVKKLMFSSDIDNLYEDYVQETYLSICEVPTKKIVKLYNNSVEENDPDEFYQLRNWVSRLIFNTVKSTSSNAYKKLKKHNTTEMHQTDVQWDVYEASIPDDTTITEQIKNMQ